MDSLKGERSRSSSLIFSVVSRRGILHQTEDACPLMLCVLTSHTSRCTWEQTAPGLLKMKSLELNYVAKNQTTQAAASVPWAHLGWHMLLRRPVMHFCYSFYRNWSQVGKSSFQVTGFSSRNRSPVCHSTRNVCVVGTSASLSNNRKGQWRSLNVRITIGRCHSANGTKNIKTCCTELLRKSFFLVFEKLKSCALQKPLILPLTDPLLLDEGTLFQHFGDFLTLFLSLFFFFKYSRRLILKSDQKTWSHLGLS